MKYETLSNNERIPKIGFGTWKIGGSSGPERSRDAHWRAALRSALEVGYTHFDTAEEYADGYAEELLGQAIREAGVDRESLFITSKVWSNHLHFDDLLRACEGSLRRLGSDYLNLYLIHWPDPLTSLQETFRALNQLTKEGKIRHVGVSNFNLSLLKKAQTFSETPILTDQVPYSLSERSYVKNGVLAYCQENNILLTAYSPLEQGGMRLNKSLQAIAKAHSATPYQIALAWLIQQPKVIAIPMSTDRRHQAENLDAAKIELADSEIEQLNRLG